MVSAALYGRVRASAKDCATFSSIYGPDRSRERLGRCRERPRAPPGAQTCSFRPKFTPSRPTNSLSAAIPHPTARVGTVGGQGGRRSLEKGRGAAAKPCQRTPATTAGDHPLVVHVAVRRTHAEGGRRVGEISSGDID